MFVWATILNYHYLRVWIFGWNQRKIRNRWLIKMTCNKWALIHIWNYHISCIARFIEHRCLFVFLFSAVEDISEFCIIYAWSQIEGIMMIAQSWTIDLLKIASCLTFCIVGSLTARSLLPSCNVVGKADSLRILQKDCYGVYNSDSKLWTAV